MSTTTTSATSSTSSTSSAETTDASGITHYYGLASGLDVDSIVKGLMTNDQNQLDKAKQTQQTLEWQQEAYQAITTELRTFENNYLSFSGSSTMLSSNSYSSYTGTSSDTALTVSGSSSATPGKHTVKIYQSAVAESVTGTAISPSVTGTADARTASLGGTSFGITVDGVTKQISFDTGETYSLAALNGKLQDAFGTDPSGVCKVIATDDGSGHVTFQSGGSYQSVITMSAGTDSDALAQLGIPDGASNRINVYSNNATLAQLFGNSITADTNGNFTVNINGTSVSLNTTDTLAQTFQKINGGNAGVSVSYNGLTDAITFTSTVGGTAGGVNLDDSTGFFTDLLGSASGRTTVSGRDAILSIDGSMVSRSTNSFTISGTNYTVNNDVSYTANPAAITISLTPDVDSAVSNIEAFVNAYNKLLTDVNTAVDTKPDSSYPPLTASQQSTMSQSDIDAYNTKAQAGVLFNDPVVQGIADSLRDTMDGTVTTSSGTVMSLASIGITTGSFDENGQLHVDESTLRQSLQQNPADVMELFNKSSSIPYGVTGDQLTQRTQQEGLCYRIQDISNNATGSKGSLITLAGMPNEVSADNNSMYDQLKEISDKITEYTEQYKSDQTKYYNQFTQLEVYMEQMNQQSSWISSMVSGSSSS